jgi:hypothetical protein
MSEERVDGRAVNAKKLADARTPEERHDLALKGAAARWAVRATHGSADHPLKIGGLEIPCYVLEDGRRVLAMTGVVKALDMSLGGKKTYEEGDRLTRFVTQNQLKPFVTIDLLEKIKNPIRFRTTMGKLASGYEATLLADLCALLLAARNGGALLQKQKHIAERAEILFRGFSHVGIIGLVDEATGYQKHREADALATILEAFIAKELQPWVKTFPDSLFQEMFRLRGFDPGRDVVKRPKYFGTLITDVVYKRLAPGVTEELKRVTPRTESGRPKAKLFQGLTANLGYRKLLEHLGSVVTIMKLSTDWTDFIDKIDRLHPRFGDTRKLPFEQEPDDGKGL